jgi:hypothetical protein
MNARVSGVDFDAVRAALYSSSGMSGTASSLSHCLNSDAATCGSSISSCGISPAQVRNSPCNHSRGDSDPGLFST